MRVVVVGSGIAGLVAAIRAARHHEVVLVTKAGLSESSTRYAQGGIAAALFPDDGVALHAADTVAAGAGLCDPDAVAVLCGEGPQRVRDLIALGVEFDLAADGQLARGQEAAHSRRRVLHAGGDATGLAVESALVRAVRRVAVQVHEHTFLRDLVVTEDASGARRVGGIHAIGPDGTPRVIPADAVVLATGGAGRLFQHTTNPEVATGDGVAAAFRAGAVVQDVEFMQFHPTSLAVPGNPLVSEAVRGEGAVLLDEHGHRFMRDVHPDAELAPRDVVARGIAAAMARQGGRPVLLDATALGRDFLAERFPRITRTTAEHGFDWAIDSVPVTPAAHYWMGGVRTDLRGRTTLAGLYAVGEAACTGVHGANRLASNSLLEGLVFAWRAADALDDADALEAAPLPGRVTHPVPSPAPGTMPKTQDRMPTRRPGAPDTPHAPFMRPEFQALMWDAAGLERDADGLRTAASILDGWAAGGCIVDGVTADAPAVAELEDRNMIELGRLMIAAALHRDESRGAHRRRDAPEPRDEFAHSISWVTASPGSATAVSATPAVALVGASR